MLFIYFILKVGETLIKPNRIIIFTYTFPRIKRFIALRRILKYTSYIAFKSILDNKEIQSKDKGFSIRAVQKFFLNNQKRFWISIKIFISVKVRLIPL